ncbi:hypothetical protein [uncultured Brevundimonas sp.]|uniref:PhnE/PtxC family ABC transporter permease n=1 Tax=uncultured Brevundimonas sp. TaxID=213418 RepID=UPI00260CB4E2|nr:hypothetical protein [uncultured Brevundimonas sp.]
MIQGGERRTFSIIVVVAIAVVAWSCWRAELVPWRSGGGSVTAVLNSFLPPAGGRDFLLASATAAAETVAVAVLGTVLALLIGLPLGLLSSRAVMIGPRFAARWQRPQPLAQLIGGSARLLAAGLRSVPEVVWAVILVRVVGLGPTAGVIALGVAYGGMIAKVAAEQLELADPAPAAALSQAGSLRLGTLLWAHLPMTAPGLSDYAIYRFECAVRASALMGYVGGGGLGFQIEHSYGYSRYDEVTTQVLILMLLVVAVEWCADRVRRWWS